MTPRISPTALLKYEECPRAYRLTYVEGWRPVARPAALAFGTAIHRGIEAHLSGLDAREAFLASWEESNPSLLSFSSRWDEEKMRTTGMELMSLFPEAWDKAGLLPLVDEEGNRVVERTLSIPGLPLSGTPDFVGFDGSGTLVVLDFKTPASPTPPDFALVAEQLTAYQALVESDPGLGVGPGVVGKVGFMDLVKRPVSPRGKGPEVLQPVLVPARPQAEVREYLEKVRHLVGDIERGRFPKRPLMGHNTPCGMCSYKELCLRGDRTGLERAGEETALGF